MSSLFYNESELLRNSVDEDLAAFARRTKPPASGSLAVVGQTALGVPNDIQRIFLGNADDGFPTGGSFTLSKTDIAGAVVATTVPITWSTNGAAVAAATQAALVTIYGVGNVTVAPIAWPQALQATFQGALTNTLVYLMKCNSAALTGPKSPYKNEVRHIAFGEPNYPTVAQAYYRIAICNAGGDEIEGGPVGISSSLKFGYAFNCGTSIPPVNTNVLCRRTRDGFAFRFSAC